MHKPQKPHLSKSAPRPHDLQIGGKPPEEVNADVAEMEKNESAPKRRAKTNVEPEEYDRQVRVSRNVEEHELENALQSLSTWSANEGAVVAIVQS